MGLFLRIKTQALHILTQKLLHLLQTHVYVDTGAVVVCGAARVSQAASPFEQQEEKEEAPGPPHHRVWPTSTLRRGA